MGFDGIGFTAIGELGDSIPPLYYDPVSRLVSGGSMNTRPAQVAELGVDLLWDNGDYIIWDNGDRIAWE